MSESGDPIDTISASPEAPRNALPSEEPVEVKPIEIRKIAVVGEIPFSGRALVQTLLKQGFSARVLCEDEQTELAVLSALPPKSMLENPPTLTPNLNVFTGRGADNEPVPSVEVVRGSLESAKDIETALKGAYGVCFLSPITLNGRMYRGKEHVEDVKRLSQAAQNGAIRKLVYHSALGAHPESQSRALRQAAEAEEVIHAAKCEDFRVRTGPLMGRNDGFLSDILRAASTPAPLMKILGYGSTPVQPLHVNDMAACVTRIFSNQPDELQAGYYCLAGPESTTLLDLIDRAAERVKRHKLKIHIPLFALQLWLSLNKGNGFREQVNLLFDTFYTEENDAPRLMTGGRVLTTPTQAQEEILTAGVG
jgi:uncharacterized protein YbjT (DUF2867 family)